MTAPRYEPGGEPAAVVTRHGRWLYGVHIAYTPLLGLGVHYGPNGGDWYVLGHRRAQRKARRKLARFLRQEARTSRPEVIR